MLFELDESLEESLDSLELDEPDNEFEPDSEEDEEEDDDDESEELLDELELELEESDVLFIGRA